MNSSEIPSLGTCVSHYTVMTVIRQKAEKPPVPGDPVGLAGAFNY